MDVWQCLNALLYRYSETTVRRSHWRCSIKKSVPKNFTKFTGKHLCQGLFFNKVAGLRTLAQLFSFDFTKFLATHILQNIYRQLFLNRIVLQTWRVQFFHGCNLRVKLFTSFTENLTNFCKQLFYTILMVVPRCFCKLTGRGWMHCRKYESQPNKNLHFNAIHYCALNSLKFQSRTNGLSNRWTFIVINQWKRTDDFCAGIQYY